jgi:predicted DNA-binding ribbon-helix-helix protein
MVGQKHRTRVLLEREQYNALVEIAHQEQRSISDLVRGIVSQYLRERGRETERQHAVRALESLTNLRTEIEQRSGVYQGDVVAETWAERDEQAGLVWSRAESPSL